MSIWLRLERIYGVLFKSSSLGLIAIKVHIKGYKEYFMNIFFYVCMFVRKRFLKLFKVLKRYFLPLPQTLPQGDTPWGDTRFLGSRLMKKFILKILKLYRFFIWKNIFARLVIESKIVEILLFLGLLAFFFCKWWQVKESSVTNDKWIFSRCFFS